MSKFKPMLAETVDLNVHQLSYPKIVSVKYNGIRCLVKDGVAVSRKLIPIPNQQIQEALSKPEYEGFDGEIVTYTDDVADSLNKVNSKVMSRDKDLGDWCYWVFDDFTAPGTFMERVNAVTNRTVLIKDTHLFAACQTMVYNLDDLDRVVSQHRACDEEGTIVRCPDAPYKHGRSTLKQEWMLKVKAWNDDEGEVVGFTELMRNANEAVEDALGHTKRSAHQENMVPAGTLGTVVVRWCDVNFELGTGFTAEDRQWAWDNREKLLGTKVTFKYLSVSQYGIPQNAVWLAWRKDL